MFGVRIRLQGVSEWWRVDNYPTASEWQALWAFMAAAIAGFLLWMAGRQLRGVRESNQELAKSNELLAASNREMSRPLVLVEFAFERTPLRNYTNQTTSATVYVVVRNVGASPARDITLMVSPEFAAVSSSVAKEALDALNARFGGSDPIRMLPPGQELRYVLDSATEAVGNNDLPAEYVVEVSYSDIASSTKYGEQFVLQMAPWAMSVAQVEPLRQISKDLQFVSENLRSATKGLPRIATEVKRISASRPAPVVLWPRRAPRVRAGRKLRGTRR